MVSIQNVILVGGLALFVVAGGVGLTKQAVGQAKSDISKLKTGVSSNVQNIRKNFVEREDMQNKSIFTGGDLTPAQIDNFNRTVGAGF